MENENQKPLGECVKTFVNEFKADDTYALLYAPDRCYLGLVGNDGAIDVSDAEGRFRLSSVFEAKVFNKHAEIRWLNGFGEAIISDKSFEKSTQREQTYLIWGEKLKDREDGKWTTFGSSQVGTFEVPVKIAEGKTHAQFNALEYLVEDPETGNVYVADERLTGICAYSANGGEADA